MLHCVLGSSWASKTCQLVARWFLPIILSPQTPTRLRQGQRPGWKPKKRAPSDSPTRRRANGGTRILVSRLYGLSAEADLQAARGECLKRAQPVNSSFLLHAHAARKLLHIRHAGQCSVAREAAVHDMICSCRQRGADDWARREEWRANDAKSPTSCNNPETPRLEQGPDYRSETAFTAKTGLGDPGTARTRRQSAGPGFAQRRHRQQVARL